MPDVLRLDTIEATTPLEARLLAMLAVERRKNSRLIKPPPEPKPKFREPVYTAPPPLPKPPKKPPAFKAGIERIQKAVAVRFGFTRHELLSQHRQYDLVLARQVAVTVAYALTGYSYPSLGRRFNRDHTTMLHSVAKMRYLHDALVAELDRADPLDVWVECAYLKALAGKAKPPKPVNKGKSDEPVLDIAAERASFAETNGASHGRISNQKLEQVSALQASLSTLG